MGFGERGNGFWAKVRERRKEGSRERMSSRGCGGDDEEGGGGGSQG